MKFTEARLEQAIIELLEEEGYPHYHGESISREPGEVLIKDDLRAYLNNRYGGDNITSGEINSSSESWKPSPPQTCTNLIRRS